MSFSFFIQRLKKGRFRYLLSNLNITNKGSKQFIDVQKFCNSALLFFFFLLTFKCIIKFCLDSIQHLPKIPLSLCRTTIQSPEMPIKPVLFQGDIGLS